LSKINRCYLYQPKESQHKERERERERERKRERERERERERDGNLSTLSLQLRNNLNNINDTTLSKSITPRKLQVTTKMPEGQPVGVFTGAELSRGSLDFWCFSARW